MVMYSNELQFMKAPPSFQVAERGMVTLAKELHFMVKGMVTKKGIGHTCRSEPSPVTGQGWPHRDDQADLHVSIGRAPR